MDPEQSLRETKNKNEKPLYHPNSESASDNISKPPLAKQEEVTINLLIHFRCTGLKKGSAHFFHRADMRLFKFLSDFRLFYVKIFS